jgi:hypothetical protein
MSCAPTYDATYLTSLKIQLAAICPCTTGTTYQIKVENLLNRLEAVALGSGTLTVTTATVNDYKISKGTFDLTTVTALVVHPITGCTVTRAPSLL